ncbi:MAG: 4Fe-4S binding protein [bacterium]|nr:4Fe-4S binding protein [bacterium]
MNSISKTISNKNNTGKREKIRKRIIYISLALFPITFNYFSPALIIFAAKQGIINGSLIIFGLLFLFSLFFGRAFCGWLCPAGGLQETCAKVRKKKVKTGIVDSIKFIFIWAPWIGAIAYFAWKAGGYISVDPFFMTPYGISIQGIPEIINFSMVALIIAGVALIWGKRGFCHYGCWMAPFMIIGTSVRNWLKLPGLRLKSDKSKCSNCALCTANCPMSLTVSHMVRQDSMAHSECILCGKCVDSCEKDVISFTLK